MPILPKGERATDVKHEHGRVKAFRFRLALAARKYPIQLAVILSLAVVAYPVVLLIDAKNDLVEATAAIQENRQAVDLADCLDQNKRHDDTVAALRAGSDVDIENAKTKAGKQEIARRRDVTLALIDALAPHQDCEARAKQLEPETG